jgi:hypothetical protein
MTVTTSVPEAPRPNTRENRALELYRSRGPEIVNAAPDLYLVPSQDARSGRVYRVVYGEQESCSCPDHQYRGLNCVHIYAVGISLAKRRSPRPCACNNGWITIGQLVVDPETGEETEEYALYLCRRCADAR